MAYLTCSSTSSAAEMEAADPDVEPTLFWLVENILVSFGAGKMQTWIHQVGLNKVTEKLKLEIERVGLMVGAVKGKDTKPLARSLGRLKELLYDADVVVDELDYHRLEHQVEAGMISSADHPQGMDATVGAQATDISSISSKKMDRKRSALWNDFKVLQKDDKGSPLEAQCIHCQAVLKCPTAKGTKVLSGHLGSMKCKNARVSTEQLANPSSSAAIEPDTGSRGKKRKRTDESSKHIPLNMSHFSSKMTSISRDLRTTLGNVNEALKLYGLHPVQPGISSPGPTTSFVAKKIYGRSVEKESIIKVIGKDTCDAITVVPIVGIGGVGKTSMAQFAYNCSDPDLRFEFKIWIPADKFCEVSILKGMINIISPGRHELIDNLYMLQEILKNGIESKKILLILDEILDSMDPSKWRNLVALIKSCNTKKMVLLVTTRSFSVAKIVGTIEPIYLGSLEEDEFWPLFRECAFGDDNKQEHPILNAIGKKIVQKLQGNPLAAETAGMLLREDLSLDHWNHVLKCEKWKSLELRGGIMVSLKRSYDIMSEDLKRCFRYCCLFPKTYAFSFGGERLISCWISQGFVHDNHNDEKLEATGKKYLSDLVKCGLLKRTKTTNSDTVSMHPLMHDLAQQISKYEISIIDGSDCMDIGPAVRHLCIAEVSEGTVENFDKKMKKVTSVKNLRSLLVIGCHDQRFLSDLRNIAKEAKQLRVLLIGEDYASFLEHLNCAHLRFLEVQFMSVERRLAEQPACLRKFYHLQVLYAPSIRGFYGLSNLFSVRLLSVAVGARSSGEMRDHPAEQCFEMTEVQSMNELVHLRILRLENVNAHESRAAKLREKNVLENLYLSWTATNDGSEHCTDTEGTIEGLEPHQNLKDLDIKNYNGATCPRWLATTVTSLQTLEISECRKWQKLPSLQRLPYLTKLILRNLMEVTEVLIPSLEVLVLEGLPKLEKCSCNCLTLLNSRIRELHILWCDALKEFPLLERGNKLNNEESWMPCLSTLRIDCPQITLPSPLPPSSGIVELYVKNPNLPTMIQSEASRKLSVELNKDQATLLNHNILAFHRLSLLTELEIRGQRDITSVMFSSLSELINLHVLSISECKEVWFSDVSQEQTHEYMAVPPYLKDLSIGDCGIKGCHLFRMLKHLRALKKLSLWSCHLTGLKLEENSSNLPALEVSSSRSPSSLIQDELLCIPSNVISSLKNLCIQDCGDPTFYGSKDSFSKLTSLEYLGIWEGANLFSTLVHETKINGKTIGSWLLSESIVNLVIQITSSPGMGTEGIPQCPDMLRLCFPENQSRLQTLKVTCSSLESLQLHSCTSLEELEIGGCELLTEIEGWQYLDVLRHLNISNSPEILPCLENNAMNVCQLESLEIDTFSVLTMSFCNHLTSLQCLQFIGVDVLPRLTDEQDRALQLLRSLQELTFSSCNSLEDLPVGLYHLPSLKKLKISCCPNVLKLPDGLPTSLEILEVDACSKELTEECRTLTLAKCLPICVN